MALPIYSSGQNAKAYADQVRQATGATPAPKPRETDLERYRRAIRKMMP